MRRGTYQPSWSALPVRLVKGVSRRVYTGEEGKLPKKEKTTPQLSSWGMWDMAGSGQYLGISRDMDREANLFFS